MCPLNKKAGKQSCLARCSITLMVREFGGGEEKRRKKEGKEGGRYCLTMYQTSLTIINPDCHSTAMLCSRNKYKP